MNDEAVYRTAPATPGLLKNKEFAWLLAKWNSENQFGPQLPAFVN